MRIAHVALWTRDLDAAAAFFQLYFEATIGEPYRSQRRQGFVSRFVALPGGAEQIELMTGPWVGGMAPIESAGWDHLAISLGDEASVDALAARCAADGLTVSPPRWTGDGFYEAVIEMPCGAWIEITS